MLPWRPFIISWCSVSGQNPQAADVPKNQVSCSFSDQYKDLGVNPHIPMYPTFTLSQWIGAVKVSHLSFKSQKHSSEKGGVCSSTQVRTYQKQYTLVKRTSMVKMLKIKYKERLMKPELCLQKRRLDRIQTVSLNL